MSKYAVVSLIEIDNNINYFCIPLKVHNWIQQIIFDSSANKTLYTITIPSEIKDIITNSIGFYKEEKYILDKIQISKGTYINDFFIHLMMVYENFYNVMDLQEFIVDNNIEVVDEYNGMVY